MDLDKSFNTAETTTSLQSMNQILTKRKSIKIYDTFRYNERTNKYKSLEVFLSGDKVLFVITEGVKKGDKTRIKISLDWKELNNLSKVLNKTSEFLLESYFERVLKEQEQR